MSYCRKRKGISDVYMYPLANGSIQCCSCILNECACGRGAVQTFTTAEEALAHLHEHIDVGDNVPAYAIKRLEKVIAKKNYNI